LGSEEGFLEQYLWAAMTDPRLSTPFRSLADVAFPNRLNIRAEKVDTVRIQKRKRKKKERQTSEDGLLLLLLYAHILQPVLVAAGGGTWSSG
jgi:hypothetical protein